VIDTPVSRSLGATFSELIGQPTPLESRVLAPTTAALVTRTTETISSSIASSERPPIVTTTLEATTTVSATQGQASALASTSQLADLAIETAEQTQTASLTVPESEGQPPLAPADSIVLSPESDDDATQFQISHRTSASESSAPTPPSNP
jgi:hypothetical protein